MRLKQIVRGWRTANMGNRSLLESLLVPELEEVIKDLAKIDINGGVLVGGTALAFYVKPRYTEDIDLLYQSREHIPNELLGFKRTRPGTFQHNKTHVEVELVTPESVNKLPELVQQVIADAVESNGIRVVSKSGLVAMKLQRANRQDQFDIIQLIQSGGVDISKFTLSDKEIAMYKELEAEIDDPKNQPNQVDFI